MDYNWVIAPSWQKLAPRRSPRPMGGAKSLPLKSSSPHHLHSPCRRTGYSLQCSRNLEGIIQTCSTPLEESKCEGPSPVLTFLGMELDSIRMEIRQQTSAPIIRMGGTQVAVPHWVLATRLQGGTSGPLVPTEADHTLHSSSTS